MTGAEIVVAEAGAFLLASEGLAAYVVLTVSDRAREAAGEAVRAARQAVEFNWVRGGVKLEVTAPDGRYPKPKAEPKGEPAAEVALPKPSLRDAGAA